jgi:hypothetical protein
MNARVHEQRLARKSVSLVGRFVGSLVHRLQQGNADFQSAVSQNFILLSVWRLGAPANAQCSADYKSAIRQIENLRYELGLGPRQACDYMGVFAKRTTKGVTPCPE